MITRELRPWEMLQAAVIAKEFHDLADCGTQFSPERFWRTLDSMKENEALFFKGLFSEGLLVGLLIGTIAPQMMTETMVAQEIMWYVKPKHRRSTGSIRLLRDFEAWAKSRGADGIIMASFAAAGEEKLSKFYSRMGYKHLETHVLKLL